MHGWRYLVILVMMSAWASPARAESIASTADLSLSMAASVAVASPGDRIELELVLHNDGFFGVDRAAIAIELPASVVVESPAPAGFDEVTGQWVLDAGLAAYDSATLVLGLEIDAAADAPITIVAEVIEADGSWSPYDPDSTPGNHAPCEDDYATVTVALDGVDGGAGEVDAGPGCAPPPRPDAGTGSPGGDGDGSGADGDAGIGGMPQLAGCNSSGGSSRSHLLLVMLVAIALRRTAATR